MIESILARVAGASLGGVLANWAIDQTTPHMATPLFAVLIFLGASLGLRASSYLYPYPERHK
jgi:hypothetical protein